MHRTTSLRSEASRQSRPCRVDSGAQVCRAVVVPAPCWQRLSRERLMPQRAKFDVFAVHPYSLDATPTKRAFKSGDLLVGDMPEVARWSGRRTSSTPQRRGSPSDLGNRVCLVYESSQQPSRRLPIDGCAVRRLLDVRDVEKRCKSRYLAVGCGFSTSRHNWWRALFAPGTPKLTEQAFAFPVVAGVASGQGFVWGRAPVSHRVRVLVQRPSQQRWLTVAACGPVRRRFRCSLQARGNGRLPRACCRRSDQSPLRLKTDPARQTHSYPSRDEGSMVITSRRVPVRRTLADLMGPPGCVGAKERQSDVGVGIDGVVFCV